MDKESSELHLISDASGQGMIVFILCFVCRIRSELYPSGYRLHWFRILSVLMKTTPWTKRLLCYNYSYKEVM